MTSPINGIPIPSMSDPPHLVNAVTPIINNIDTRMIPRFTTTANRDAAIAAPTAGMACYVSGTDEIYVYRTGWVSMVPRMVFKTADTARSSTISPTADPHLTFSVEANSKYFGELVCIYKGAVSSGSAGGLRLTCTGPAAMTAKATSFFGPHGLSSTVSDVKVDSVTDWLSTHIGIGSIGTSNNVAGRVSFYLTTSATAGTFSVSWAQVYSNATATTLMIGSSLELWKVG